MTAVDHIRWVGTRLALLASLGIAGTGLLAAHAASAGHTASAGRGASAGHGASAGYGASVATAASGLVSTGAAASPATWSVQHTPPIPDPDGGLASVSCVTSDFCAAVAGSPGPSGLPVAGPPLYLWNGKSWQPQSVPHGKGWRAILTDVSCTSSTFCMAVGFQANATAYGPALVYVWRGTSWTMLPFSRPGEATGISCSSATACFAVGSPPLGTGWAEQWNGTNWTTVKLAPAGQEYGLTAVSCSGASACTAVGSDIQGGVIQALIERWNGTSMTVQKSVQPTAVNLNDVSCPRANGCVAVGSTGTSPKTPFAESWNGTAWTAMKQPNGAGYLLGISCTAVTACTAVGLRGSDTGSYATLAERLSGITWTLQQTPPISGTLDAELADVSCLAAGECLATGQATTLSYASESVGEQWTGTQWILQTTPNSPYPDQQGQFTGVSCPQPKACAALGHYDSSLLSTQPVGELWNGSTWSVTGAIGAPQSVTTTGISCSSATSCLAVGDYGGNKIPPWAEVWNGTTWTSVNPPPPSGNYVSLELSGVSCASATFCVTLGTVAQRGGNYQRAYSWNGSAWAVMPMPSAPGGTLSAVSCPSTNWCMAVGSGNNWVADTWNGTAWTLLTTTGSPLINAVSCTSPTACTAVGNPILGQTPVAAIERWNGTAWSAQQPAPNPPGTAVIQLNGVSCATATACTAVGSYSLSNNTTRAIIESWTGGTWAVVPPPTHAISQLAAVSCASATACTAVGLQVHGRSNQSPLVESSG